MSAGKVFSWTAAIVAGASFALGVFQYLHSGQGADWLSASGGLGVVAYAGFQLELEKKRDGERRAAARAKARPIAYLARRSCDESLRRVGANVGDWYGSWYSMPGERSPMDILQEQLTQVVTIAADGSPEDLAAADRALAEFTYAANIINPEWKVLLDKLLPIPEGVGGAVRKLALNNEAAPRATQAAAHIRSAAQALAHLAPRLVDEAPLPAARGFHVVGPVPEGGE